MDSRQQPTTVTPSKAAPPTKYSRRVALKPILDRGDCGVGLIGERLVVGGWVRSSKEERKEPHPAPATEAPEPALHAADSGHKDVTCSEILQSRFPFFRTIVKVLGGRASSPAVREKLQSIIPMPPPPSTLFLQIADGSCVSSLLVVIESAIAPVPVAQLLQTGTCILVEGVMKEPSFLGKQVVELKAEKILHVGTVEPQKYPLSKKRLPLDSLRDFAHFRARTTTVATVMRIRSALNFATHAFFQNNGFLYVQVPIITGIDFEGLGEKFKVTTILGRTSKKDEMDATKDNDGVSLETLKAAIKDKSDLVEQLKRTESNREALLVAQQDLRKTNELAQQLEAKEKKKPVTVKADVINFNDDFFHCQSYLTVSGRLHLESYASALGHVYSFGPRFQADKTGSSKLVAEMWMVETEMVFTELEDAMRCAEDYFNYLCKWVLDNCPEDMKFVSKRVDKSIVDRLHILASNPCRRISYTEAIDELRKVTKTAFEAKIQWGVALTSEHLSYLADEIYKSPVIIYDYPRAVKPFYVRSNAGGNTVAAFDMVLPKVGTLISGSQNEERLDVLNSRIKELNLPKEQYEWYLDLRRHGTVKHSGFSLRFDVMALVATGLVDVRDVIPFPRTSGKLNCLIQVKHMMFKTSIVNKYVFK